MMNRNTKIGRNVAATTVLMLSAGFATNALAYQTFVDSVLSNNGATPSATADATQGTLGKLDAKFQQLLVNASSSQYPSTGSCNVCHGSGSSAGGDASANKSAAKSSNWAYFAAPVVTNTAPKVSVTAPKAVTEPTAVSFKLTVTDAEGDAVTVTASGDINGVPASSYYNDATRTFTWSTTVAGTYAVTFTPNDGKLNGASATVNITVDPATTGGGSANNAPMLTKPVNGSTYTASVGTAVSIAVEATDQDGDDVTVSYTGTDGSSGDVPVTYNATSNSWTGSFAYTPASATLTSVKFTFTAKDVKTDPAQEKTSSATVTVKINQPSTGGTGISAIDATRASWTSRRSTLSVAGTVTAPTGTRVAGKIVTITNTATGATIGTAKVAASRRTPNKGTWSSITRQSSSAVPCSVTASIDALSDSIAVANAPESACSGDDGEDDDSSADDRSTTTTSTSTTTDTGTVTTTPGKGKGKKK